MTKIKSPLLSLGATKTIGKVLTFVRRRGQNIVEVKPEIPDAKTLAQLSWRHMYQKAIALWHALSAAEKQEWESLARPKHMTGYAWFISQALKPNPGLYLPLQGGTMQGIIEMDDHHIHGLPIPVHAQDPLRVFEYNSAIAPFLYNEGARAYHTAGQSIPNNTATIVALNSERYDTDEIHDLVVNNSRLTCKTAGIYVITASIRWPTNNAGHRSIRIKVSGSIMIATSRINSTQDTLSLQAIAAIWALAVGQYVELELYQTSGGALILEAIAAYSPELAMERVGLG